MPNQPSHNLNFPKATSSRANQTNTPAPTLIPTSLSHSLNSAMKNPRTTLKAMSPHANHTNPSAPTLIPTSLNHMHHSTVSFHNNIEVRKWLTVHDYVELQWNGTPANDHAKSQNRLAILLIKMSSDTMRICGWQWLNWWQCRWVWFIRGGYLSEGWAPHANWARGCPDVSVCFLLH